MTTNIYESLAALLPPARLRLENNTPIAAPDSTGQLATLLRFASENRLPVVPQGAGTKQLWSNPLQAAFLLETRHLNALIDHTWQDMTATVQAGCTWAAMQSELARHGQFVALDPHLPERATIGGIVSTNDSGALRHKYGSLRDLIIGMTVVLADGTIARTGGKVVKNVAGYDLHKLMTGAFGTLGVITEITFRLHAIPQHTLSLTVASPAPQPLGALLHLILNSHLSTQALQLRGDAHGFFLDVQLAAIPQVLESQSAEVAALASGLSLTAEPAPATSWSARLLPASDHEAFLLKATMLPSEIPAFAAAVHAAGGASTTQAVGVGIATLPAASSAQLLDLRRRLEAAHGSLTVLVQPPGSVVERWGTPPDTLPLMRGIKHRFDPNAVLNPGRFLGAI